MRKPPEKRNTAPVARDGVDFRTGVFEENTEITTYYMPMISATELAAAILSRRYRLAPPTARLVCHLAGIGGAA